MDRNHLLDSPFHRVLHLFRLWHRALPARQAQRAFREARETRAAGSRPGSARSDPFITAFNEADIVDEKMANSLELDYPEEKLHIVWVTDGSDDGTNERLRTRWEGKATVFFQPERQGKTAAMNRG